MARMTFRNARQIQVNEEMPTSQTWLNVGKPLKIGDSERFVNMPLGIPLDSLEPFKLNIKNPEFRRLRQAQNMLLEQVKAIAMGLEPGEEKTLNLEVRVRRVEADYEESEPEPIEFDL